MKNYAQQLREAPILSLYAEIRKRRDMIEMAQRDLATMREVLADRTCAIPELLAEIERLYDEADKEGTAAADWANTLGFLRTVPSSKHYRKPPAGISDIAHTFGAVRNEFDRALDIERKRRSTR